MPRTASPGPERELRRGGTALALVLVSSLPLSAASVAKRELAQKYYQQAAAQRLEIETLPDSERERAVYQKVIDAFRQVYLTNPQSSRADDSLVAIAEIYVVMSRRFGPEPYRGKAVEAYKFLIKEYPYSPFCKQAREKLEELEAAPAVAAAAPPVAEPPAPAPAAAKQGLAQVTDVRHWSSPGLTRVIVDLEAEVKVRGDRLNNPDRVYFDLPNTRLSAELKSRTVPVGDGLVKQIRMAHTQIGVTRVVVDLNSSAEYTLSMLTNPPRVALELRAPDAVAAKAAEPPAEPAKEVAKVAAAKRTGPKIPPPKAAQPTSRGERNLIRALGLKISRVVIDAGHGGHDTGTIGPTGLMEKDLALDVANRLGALVSERLGSEVVLTRTDDTFIALEDRTGLANEKQADLFISVHANSSSQRGVRGIETYYLNLTADREALDVAARENAASQKSIHELGDLVSKIALTEKISESREFAGQVQRSLYAAISRDSAPLRNRGVRKAPFVVLIGARMPSALAEISFLSNPRDEKLLKTPAYRQKIAEALYNGLVGYAKTLSRVEVAAFPLK